MKKIANLYNKIDALRDAVEELIGELEEKQCSIEEHANDMDRDMTEREEERWNEIDGQLDALRECLDNLE